MNSAINHQYKTESTSLAHAAQRTTRATPEAEIIKPRICGQQRHVNQPVSAPATIFSLPHPKSARQHRKSLRILAIPVSPKREWLQSILLVDPAPRLRKLVVRLTLCCCSQLRFPWPRPAPR